jgi:predicted alpha/beta superfamily hydrolase
MWVHGYRAARLALAACVFALSACGGGGGGGSANNSSSGTGSGTTTAPIPDVPHGDTDSSVSLTSAFGVEYPLRIYTPPGYTTDTARHYPVIYGLDGDTNYGLMVTALEQLGVRAILVGIGRSDLRDYDYQTPGAPAYYSFLTQVLVPYMDGHYRTQPSNGRTLVGHSFGGSFVALALFMDQPSARVFSNYVSLDGAWDENSTDLKLYSQEPLLYAASHGQLPATVVLAGATCCHYAAAQQLYTQLQSRNYQGLRLTLVSYPQSHSNMFVPAFTDAMQYLFVP